MITNTWQRQSYALISNLRSSPRWAPSLTLSSRRRRRRRRRWLSPIYFRQALCRFLSSISLSVNLMFVLLTISLCQVFRFTLSSLSLSLSLQLTKVSSFFVRLLCIGLFSKIYSFSLGFDDFEDTYILISSSLVSFWIWKKSWKHVNDVNERNYIIIQLLGMIILFIFWFFLFGVCGFFFFFNTFVWFWILNFGSVWLLRKCGRGKDYMGVSGWWDEAI